MDIIDIVLGGKRGSSSGGAVMTDDVNLNDYGLHCIEMMIAMGGGSLTIEREQYPNIDEFWGLIMPWMPPALLVVSTLMDPGQKIYTYPTSIGCKEDKPIWVSTQLTLLWDNQVMTVTINLSKVTAGMFVVVTVSKTAIPE